MRRWVLLAVFPILETSIFMTACWASKVSLLFAFSLAVVGSIFLSYSVHITFHECVHQLAGQYSPLPYLISILQGLPFDGYRLHHYNHHRYENKYGDYSSTWRFTTTGMVPRSLLAYSFGWPAGLMRSRAGIREANRKGELNLDRKIIIRCQSFSIAAFLLLLALFDAQWAMLYLFMIYLGWILVSAHNYFQHPPVNAQGLSTTSYYGSWYNRLFLNNGLHREHHAAPMLAWNQLKAHKK